MTKQEEMREGMLVPLIKHYLTGKRLTVIDYNRIADEQLAYLHSQGVVIKVEKEPPLIFLKDAEEHDTKWAESNFTDSLQEFGKETQRNMLKVGYIATEPLIKEKK